MLPWKKLAKRLRWRWLKTKGNLRACQSEKAVLARNLAAYRQDNEAWRVRAQCAEARVREAEKDLREAVGAAEKLNQVAMGFAPYSMSYYHDLVVDLHGRLLDSEQDRPGSLPAE